MDNLVTDVRTREDIASIVDTFYNQAILDKEIGYIFTDVAKLDLQKHIPIICDFWETVLFGNMLYRGSVVAKHISLHRKSSLKPEHFERWLEIWTATIQDKFSGKKAEEMISRAGKMAEMMKHKIDYFDNNPFAIV